CSFASVRTCELTRDLFLYFFFSSRRRHTRFSRDWSSDVCSSDLIFPYYRENEKANLFNYKSNKKIAFEEDYFKTNFPNAYKYLEGNKVQLLNRDKGKNAKY